MKRATSYLFALSWLFVAASACAPVPPIGNAGGFATSPLATENQLFVPVSDREFLWNQVVDEVDDYFKIRREERVRLIGNVLTEGQIDTFPQIGSTKLEPWRHDSTRGFEKLHSTLQTVRRRAVVRVIPASNGYLVDVVVFKELEDVVQSEHASAGDMTLRYDDSLTRYQQNGEDQARVGFGRSTLGWIPLGRDHSLEQQILANLRGRMTDVGSAGPPPYANVDVTVQQ